VATLVPEQTGQELTIFQLLPLILLSVLYCGTTNAEDMYNIVGRGKICGVPWHDNGDNQRSWSFGAPQQTFRRSRTYRHIPSGQTASHTQMTRVFRVGYFYFKNKISRIEQLMCATQGLISMHFISSCCMNWVGYK